MKVISSEADFDRIEIIQNHLVYKDKEFPDNIFKIKGEYLFFEYAHLTHSSFYSKFLSLIKKIGEPSFFVTELNPDSREFFKHFNYYSCFEFSHDDTEKDFYSALKDYPVDSPGDSLAISANYIMVSSYSGRWAVIGDRDFNITVCFFADDEVKSIFEREFKEELLEDVEEAADFFNNFILKPDLEAVFIKNYSSE